MNARARYWLSLKRFLIDVNLELDSYIDWIRDYSGQASEVHLSWVDDASEVPTVVIDLLILEDHRFFSHGGVDISAIPRGLKRLLNYGRVAGVSTIEQQLIRTINKRQERKVMRKVRECFFAVLLNRHFSKIRILDAYLSTIYLGPHLHGVGTASEFLFGADIRNLGRAECALLASMPPYPIPSVLCRIVRSDGPFPSSEALLAAAETSVPIWYKKINARLFYLAHRREKYQISVLKAILKI